MKIIFLCAALVAVRTDPEPVELVPPKFPDSPRVRGVKALTAGPKHHFFGYYGIDPWDESGHRFACLETEISDRLVAAGDRADVCIVDEADASIRRIAQTTAWNLQQGAMLHWLGDAPRQRLLFNDRRDGTLASIAMDREGGRRVLPHPVAAVSPDGRVAVSLDFERLRAIRPVTGYAGGPPAVRIEPMPDDNGLWICSLESGQSRLLVSIRRCFRLTAVPESIAGQNFWLEHPVFSRDGRRVFFMVRAFDRTSRQLVSMPLCIDADGANLKALMSWGSGGASHCDWLDDRRLALTRLVRPGAFRHLLIDVETLSVEELAPDVLTRDGHCSFSPDRQWMITDTYPDADRRQHLFLLRISDRTAHRVASFHTPANYRGDWRCDLHPRWHKNSRRLCIDSTHDGTRQVYALDLELPEAPRLQRKPATD